MGAGRKPRNVSRSDALRSRPYKMPGVRRQEPASGAAAAANGAIQLLVRRRSSRLQKWLGAPAEYDRRYELDALGGEVYQACDGKKRVNEIVARFARAHQLNAAEAELAVTTYLKTLMGKGLIGMAVDQAK